MLGAECSPDTFTKPDPFAAEYHENGYQEHLLSATHTSQASDGVSRNRHSFPFLTEVSA